MSSDKLEQLLHLGQKMPHHPISRFAGWVADSRIPPLKNAIIKNFIRYYKVNMNEAAVTEGERYPSFNSFFTRPLAQGARPVASDEQAITSPADGQLSQLGNIDGDQLIQAKGKHFTLKALLGSALLEHNMLGENIPDQSQHFTNGKFATIYLSPKDYHRVHMPIDGTLSEMVYIPGKLFSVNARTARLEDQLFARNERVVCYFDTAVGKVAVILVGAMIVASMSTVWSGILPPYKTVTRTVYPEGAITLKKGEEMGLFRLGSTVIMLFPQNSMHWAPPLQLGQSLKMGEEIANI